MYVSFNNRKYQKVSEKYQKVSEKYQKVSEKYQKVSDFLLKKITLFNINKNNGNI